jgi:hypothetical protein
MRAVQIVNGTFANVVTVETPPFAGDRASSKRSPADERYIRRLFIFRSALLMVQSAHLSALAVRDDHNEHAEGPINDGKIILDNGFY